jgi:transcriptional regulator with XRE-family HTH domain
LIEHGNRSNPSGSTLVGLARALGTSAEWLVTGEGPAPSDEALCAAVTRARASQHTASDFTVPAGTGG